MLRNLRIVTPIRNTFFPIFIQKQLFLTNDYKCNDAWSKQVSSPLLHKVNLNDFYNILDQNYTTKGVLSAIDVDIFANALNDAVYLEELRDLVHKLRLTAETGNMLDSTNHAIVRNYMEFGRIPELIDILKDPLNYGVFLDDYAANILLDKLLTSSNYEEAANVASLIMFQEEYGNEITSALCQYAAFKYIMNYIKPSETTAPEEKKKKVEEIKIRVKFLRNPYFDDHFDIKNLYTLSGKTLAWISERNNDNLNKNLQIIGWLIYKKYDKLKSQCEMLAENSSSRIYSEVIELIQKQSNEVEEESKPLLESCLAILNKVGSTEKSLDESIKTVIENAINKIQSKDISNQQLLFKTWSEIREEKLEEQTKRLDRAKRMQLMEEKQKQLNDEEQKLWFFENEDRIDLEIEKKEEMVETTHGKKNVSKTTDENYIPPEILPKRK